MPWDDIARVEHRRKLSRYPSDMTDQEWSLLAPLLPTTKRGGRPGITPCHRNLNLVFWSPQSGSLRLPRVDDLNRQPLEIFYIAGGQGGAGNRDDAGNHHV